MRRRKFIQGIASSLIAWPLASLAQQSERIHRIGVLTFLAADDPESKTTSLPPSLLARADEVIE